MAHRDVNQRGANFARKHKFEGRNISDSRPPSPTTPQVQAGTVANNAMRVNRPPAKATPSWFRDLAGFDENTDANGYELTQSRFVVEGEQLRSLVNGKSFGIGRLELLTVKELRRHAKSKERVEGVCRVRIVPGDVRQLHVLPENKGALFQVASQFNLLEMTGPGVTPKAGVSGYADDHTQGPSCTVAAGAATIYRNYLAQVAGQIAAVDDFDSGARH